MQTALLIDYSALLVPRWHEDPYTAPQATANVVRGLASIYPTLAICIDDPEATSRSWRRNLDPEYKAHRPEKPADLVAAIARGIELLRHDFPVWGVACNEADDVIASAAIALQRQSSFESIEIYSVDKDLAQLVVDKTTIFCAIAQRSHNGELIDTAGVIRKYGVHPMQMGDWLAIIGDASDNIQGVDGIGKVGATRLLAAFGSWRGIVAAAENLSSEGMTDNVRASILASRARFDLSRKLVELVQDLPIPVHQIFDRAKRDPLSCVDQPWPAWPEKEKEKNMGSPLSFADQMAALAAQLPPGSALSGQINAGQPIAAAPVVDTRQPPPPGYRYANATSMDLTFDVPAPAPQAQIQTPPNFYGAAPNGAPVATQQSLSTPFAAGQQLPLPAPQNTQAAAPVAEAPKVGRGRPRKSKTDTADGEISDDSMLEALAIVRAWMRQL